VEASCLDADNVRTGFERSNLPQQDWPGAARLVDAMCKEQGVGPADLGNFTEFSRAEAYRAASGTPGVTDTYLLAVVDVGLVLMREVGLLRKRADCQFMFFSEFQGGTFTAEESLGGRGWGHMDIQAARGSISLFRIGWPFDERSSDPSRAINAAANERDRVLQAIQRWG
jgi:hypothetical protein